MVDFDKVTLVNMIYDMRTLPSRTETLRSSVADKFSKIELSQYYELNRQLLFIEHRFDRYEYIPRSHMWRFMKRDVMRLTRSITGRANTVFDCLSDVVESLNTGDSE